MHESLNRDSGVTEGGRAYQDKDCEREREGERQEGRVREERRRGERVCVMTIVIFVMNGTANSHAFGVRSTLLKPLQHVLTLPTQVLRQIIHGKYKTKLDCVKICILY